MDAGAFHKLRAAMQENAHPASSLEVFACERTLGQELEACGLFDQADDQLAIALCHCTPDVPLWEAGYRLERVWSVLRSQASWEIHTASITQEVVEFEGAMLLPGSVQFVTVHVVALHHAEVAADRSGAQALAD